MEELYKFIIVLQLDYLQTFSAYQTPVVYKDAIKYYYDKYDALSEIEQNDLLSDENSLKQAALKYKETKESDYDRYLKSITDSTDYDSNHLYEILNKCFLDKDFEKLEESYESLKLDSYSADDFNYDDQVSVQSSGVEYVYTNNQFTSALKDTSVYQIILCEDITYSDNITITRNLKIVANYDCDQIINFSGKAWLRVSGTGNTLSLAGNEYGSLIFDYTNAKEVYPNQGEGANIEASIGGSISADYCIFRNVKAQSTGVPAWTLHGTGCDGYTVTNCKFQNVTCGIGIVGNYDENIDSSSVIKVSNCEFTGTSNSSSDKRYNNTALLINNSNRLYDAELKNNTVNGMGYFFVYANEGYASSWYKPGTHSCVANTSGNKVNNAYFQGVYVDNMCGASYKNMYTYNSTDDQILKAGEEGMSLNNTKANIEGTSGCIKNAKKRGLDLKNAKVSLSYYKIEQNNGGVAIDSGSELNIDTVTISNNAVTGNGGGILNNGTLSMEYSNYVIASNTATGNGDGVYQNGVFNMNYKACVDESNDIYLASGKYITVNDDFLTDFAGIITPSDYTAGRVCVKDIFTGNALGLEDLYKLTPKDPYLLRSGSRITGIDTSSLVISRTYNISYDANGGTNAPATQKKYWKESTLLTKNTPTRTGYSFNGWNTNSSGTGTNYAAGASYTSDADLRLYAKWSAAGYSVKFDANGGTGTMSDQAFTAGTAQNLKANTFTRTGYTFNGWNTAANGSGKSYTDKQSVTDLASAGGSVTLYAQWKPITYTIVYRGNGNTGGSTASSSHTYDVAKSLTANGFTKTGYTFAGWNTNANGTGTSYANRESVKNLTTANGGTVYLYAQWTANQYTVTYNANGGTGSMTSDRVSYDSNYVTKRNTFTRTGYTFSGWNEKADGTGTDWTAKIGVEFQWNYTRNVTLYAQWTPNTYTIVYNGNGNTGGSTASSSHTYDVAKNLTANGFTKTGYTFAGWNTRSNGSGTGYTNRESVKNLTSVNGATVTLYAQWAPISYTIVYNGNGNTGGSTVSSSHIYDVEKALTANGFTRTGYTFKNWNTRSDGMGSTYSDRQVVKNLASTSGATVTLYAQWSINSYTLTYNPNGGSVNPTSKVLNYNSAYGTLPTPTRKGYTFIGWFTAADNGTQVSSSTKMGAGDTTIYAHWRANVLTVNYYPNGATKVDESTNEDGTGVSTIDSQALYKTKEYEYDAAMPNYGLWDAQRFIRTGYTSTNMYHLGSKDGTVLLDADYNVFAKTQDLATAAGVRSGLEKGDVSISLYADWKANTYTIKYNGNGSTDGSTASSNHTYDTVKALTANGYTKTGYTFKNWNTEVNGSGMTYTDKQSVKNLASVNGATITLYAQWTPNKYTIVFNSNGGSGTMASQEMTYDKAANLTANTFKRTGYRFNGWNTTANGSGTDYADKASVKNLASAAGSTITLYAKWHSEAPVLDAKNVTYYEGQDISKSMLLKNVTKATDAEDGDVTGKVKIVKIAYAAGKLVDGKSQAAYETNWTDMPDDAKLDTWFMQLPKEKAPVTHKITYQVTDLSGKTTTKTSSITIKYNEFPIITAEDRYFTLEDAKVGNITEDALLKDAITASKLKADDVEDGNLNSRLTILDYKDTDFKNVNGNATVTVIYKVTDSMGPNGVGKETIREIKVHIIDPESPYWRDDDETKAKSIRFITKKYYDKNKDADVGNMTSEQIDSSAESGGLNVMSKWYQNSSCKNLITTTFGKTTGTDYKISAEKVEWLKDHIESNGIGNSKSSTALSTVYNSLK